MLDSVLSQARDAAASCGVTRLADVTGLDEIGVPVFQAVRPWSRSLCVHQGKGLTPDAARIGALMEAIECDHAEGFVGDPVICAFADLPPTERVTDLADFAARRDCVPDSNAPLSWVAGEQLSQNGPLWIPFDIVSLDFTQAETRFERTSNGLGAGFSKDLAIRTALLEVIERDALQAWLQRAAEVRTLDRIEIGSIPYPWFADIACRLQAADLELTIYRMPAIVTLPCFVTQIRELSSGGALRLSAYGSACRASLQEALERSVVEAVQSRLTAVSGVRDDIYAQTETQPTEIFGGFGLPLPSHWSGLHLGSLPDPSTEGAELGPAEIHTLLNAAGYPLSAVVDLTRPGGQVHVVKAVVPGLGAFSRVRRQCV